MKKLGVILCLILVGCQMEPTKVVETQSRPFMQIVEKSAKPIEIGEATVVLDVRSSFDYGLNRIANSLHFPWTNLAEHESSGEPLRDSRMAALRLSLLGVTPTTPVVIAGYGLNGKGEEGRLAWNLLLLGFQDVQVTTVEAFRRTMTQVNSPVAQNVKPWKVSLQDKLIATILDKRARVIDVRSEKEYLTPTAKQTAVLAGVNVINIEWKQFFTASGRPDVKFRDKLLSVGIHPDDRIILISNHGVRSSAAAYALLALGYSHVENFIAGL